MVLRYSCKTQRESEASNITEPPCLHRTCQSVRAHSLVVYPLSVLFPVDRGASDYVMISSHLISTIKIQGFQSMSINL